MLSSPARPQGSSECVQKASRAGDRAGDLPGWLPSGRAKVGSQLHERNWPLNCGAAGATRTHAGWPQPLLGRAALLPSRWQTPRKLPCRSTWGVSQAYVPRFEHLGWPSQARLQLPPPPLWAHRPWPVARSSLQACEGGACRHMDRRRILSTWPGARCRSHGHSGGSSESLEPPVGSGPCKFKRSDA